MQRLEANIILCEAACSDSDPVFLKRAEMSPRTVELLKSNGRYYQFGDNRMYQYTLDGVTYMYFTNCRDIRREATKDEQLKAVHRSAVYPFR